MKKVISLLLSIVMLFSVTAGLDMTAFAWSYYGTLTYGNNESVPLYLDNDYILALQSNGTVTIYRYIGSSKNVTIPSKVNGYTVSNIESSAFRNNTNLTSVTIPGTCESIGNSAFYGCTSLKTVVIQKGVKIIQYYAFYNCSSLSSVTIPDSVTEIGCFSFEYCSSLKNIVLPKSVETIGQETFYGCENLNITVLNGDCNLWWVGAFSPNVTICSYKDSEVSAYAHFYNYKFVSIYCNDGEHKLVTDIAVAPTCTKTGLTKGSHCSICGKIITAQKTVAKKEHTYKKTIKKATTTQNGSIVTKCSVCGHVKSSSKIYYPKKITLSTTKYVYNGKAKKPTVKVVDANGKTISASNYNVAHAKGRTNVGKYSVKITFKGNYSGTKTLYFTIKPKATSIVSLSAKTKGFVVKWNKRTKQTTGYQIQFSTSSKFNNPKTYTISKNSTTSKGFYKLSAKKKYFVRVRTYKVVDGKKYYSAWSSVKSVRTK